MEDIVSRPMCTTLVSVEADLRHSKILLTSGLLTSDQLDATENPLQAERKITYAPSGIAHDCNVTSDIDGVAERTTA